MKLAEKCGNKEMVEAVKFRLNSFTQENGNKSSLQEKKIEIKLTNGDDVTIKTEATIMEDGNAESENKSEEDGSSESKIAI